MIETWIQAHWNDIVLCILAAGWFFDNVLAEMPGVQSNSTFQLIHKTLDSLVAKVKGKQP